MNVKLLPAFGLIILATVVPIGLLIWLSFGHAEDSIGSHYWRFIDDWNGLLLIRFTLLFALLVATFTTSFGWGLAVLISICTPRWQRWLIVLLLMPKFSHVLALIFGMHELASTGSLVIRLLQTLGILAVSDTLLQTKELALFAEVYWLLPYVVVTFVFHLSQLDQNQYLVARSLGASSVQVHRLITWPQSKRLIWLMFSLTLVWGLGAFAGPVFLGGPHSATLSSELFRQAMTNHDHPLAAVHGVVLMLLMVFCLVIMRLGYRQ